MRQVVQLYPRYANALVALANALHTTRDYDEALALLERAQRIDSDYPLTPYLLGKIKLAQGRRQEAAEDMRRFLEIWPTDDEYASAARRIVAENGGGD